MNLLTKRDVALKGSTRAHASHATGGGIASLLSGSPASEKAALMARRKSAESQEIVRLLESILLAAKRTTNADGATLYRMTDDRRALRFEIVRNDSLHLAMGGIDAGVVSLPNVPLFNDHGEPNNSMVAAYAAIHEKTVNVADAYTEAGFDFSGTRSFDQRTGYRSQSMPAVPTKNIDGEVAGVLQLINARDPVIRKVRPFSAADQRAAESFAAQAALVVKNKSPPIPETKQRFRRSR